MKDGDGSRGKIQEVGDNFWLSAKFDKKLKMFYTTNEHFTHVTRTYYDIGDIESYGDGWHIEVKAMKV
jgi:hypothetical protein